MDTFEEDSENNGDGGAYVNSLGEDAILDSLSWLRPVPVKYLLKVGSWSIPTSQWRKFDPKIKVLIE